MADVDTLTTDSKTGDGTEASPVFATPATGSVEITSNPDLGASAVIVGLDIDNSGWLVQKTNGSIWAIDHLGENARQLFGIGSDLAGITPNMLKWHEGWGVGGGYDTSANQYFSFDENGDFIVAPYTAQFANISFCVDPDANVYSMGLFGGVNVRVAQNGSSFARGVAASGGGDTGAAPYHDGIDLYLFGGGSASGGRGVYRVEDASTTATKIVGFDTIFTDTGLSVPMSWWNNRRKRVFAQGGFTGSSHQIFFRMKTNGAKLAVFEKGGIFAPGAQVTHLWMVP